MHAQALDWPGLVTKNLVKELINTNLGQEPVNTIGDQGW